mgnify:CR=1 FL=1
MQGYFQIKSTTYFYIAYLSPFVPQDINRDKIGGVTIPTTGVTQWLKYTSCGCRHHINYSPDDILRDEIPRIGYFILKNVDGIIHQLIG